MLLTGQQRKRYLEKHHAACLAIMIGHMANSCAKITVCTEGINENADFDCVIKAVEHEGGIVVYKPVELKLLPSHQVRTSIEIQAEIDKLKKYGPDAMVSYWINRDTKIEFHKLRFDKLKIQQLWFIGGSPLGETLLHGGIIRDLISGKLQAGIIKDGKTKISWSQFKPCQSAETN